MKVLEKGTGQKGWSIDAICTGHGNGGGGCGAKLRVEQPDLFITSTSVKDETDRFITFECVECKSLTDLREGVVPGRVSHELPSQVEWRSIINAAASERQTTIATVTMLASGDITLEEALSVMKLV